MKIYFGTDHAGYELKEQLVPFVSDLGHEVADMGAQEFDPDDDYPDYVTPVAEAVSNRDADRGIILGGSGQGEDMVADKFDGVRSAVYYGGPLEIVKLSREHNDANVLSLGARFLSVDEAKAAVQLWLETEFSGDERHVRRIEKINELDEG
jgi:ribose 5-phosphate isomerase B